MEFTHLVVENFIEMITYTFAYTKCVLISLKLSLQPCINFIFEKIVNHCILESSLSRYFPQGSW